MSLDSRLLIAAGSDSSGGAGVQADLKAATAFGVFSMTAITAITVQNTLGVTATEAISPENVFGQMSACLSDIGADAIKAGMLVNAPIIEAVSGAIEACAPDVPFILDPVMISTSGFALIDDAAIETMIAELLPKALIITPNLPETKRLTGIDGTSAEGARDAAQKLMDMGAKAALIKGGHRDGDILEDMLFTADGEFSFRNPRIHTKHTHGTGCTLASAIASSVAQGVGLVRSVERARAYVQRAIADAPGFGLGYGPLNHIVPVDPA